MPDKGKPLQGVGVLVTRPEHQAHALCGKIQTLGGSSILFPVLEISDPDDLQAIQSIISHLDSYDIAIFISPNAVQRALTLVRKQGDWPQNIAVAAVGKASAKTLSEAGITTDIFPKTTFNSEALLEMPQMRDVKGKKIVVFRGEGGRELLAETLRERGADVTYAECYKRSKPAADITPLMHQWARGEVSIVTVTSNEGLSNLFDMVGQLGRKWLQKTPLLVISDRAVQLAKELGFKSEIIVAEQASDDAIIKAILDWKTS